MNAVGYDIREPSRQIVGNMLLCCQPSRGPTGLDKIKEALKEHGPHSAFDLRLLAELSANQWEHRRRSLIDSEDIEEEIRVQKNKYRQVPTGRYQLRRKSFGRWHRS